MYTLIGSPKSRTFRVLWALEELSLEYNVVPVGPRTPEVTKYNPAGKIPVLLDGDDAIIDSTAIVQYLADKHTAMTFPAGTIERAKQDSFTQFACDDLDGILWTAAKHDFVLPEELRLADVKKACVYDFGKSLTDLETRLAEGDDYVMGSTFTVPDLIIGHTAGWAEKSGIEWPAGKLTDYLARIRSRPAFVKAMQIRDAG